MGPGDNATATDLKHAYELGQSVAQSGWVLLTGGRQAGVMDAASKGAKDGGGVTIGILPNRDHQGISEAVDIAIITDMGNARNNINVLSCDVVIACGMGTGTASEIALALKNDKKVVLLTQHQESKKFFSSLSQGDIFLAANPPAAIQFVKEFLAKVS